MSSTRANIVARRTYSRPKGDGQFETWVEVINRTICHQKWLWERAKDDSLSIVQHEELNELHDLMISRAALLSGRTLWLGGTKTARLRESSQFNCAFLNVETVFDIVDAFWLLLQGCGVGLKPVPGCLFGFSTYIPKLTITPTPTKHKSGGSENNLESYDSDSKQWKIRIGDSAQAWAKSLGMILAGKHYGCRELVFDCSQIRSAGGIIKGYGWICQGHQPLIEAFRKIFEIMNRYAGKMLPFTAIHDILNHTGTVLSTRRSAQVVLCNYGGESWREFAAFKKDYYRPEIRRPWREQSNNTLDFYKKPSREELEEIFKLILESGGSEPGLRNVGAARHRAQWSRGTNPCAEILLPNRGFCNLCEINLAHPRHKDFDNLMRSLWVLARANYRQTCVDLKDGVLQSSWHENNENLRLCGVGLTGIVQREDLTADQFVVLKAQAKNGANSMADELGMTRPAAVTTIKPSGTLSKLMDCTEGMHRPLGKYIFNHIEFQRLSSLPKKLLAAGYKVSQHPTKPNSVVARFPVSWEDVKFNGIINDESAFQQLERYRMLLQNWCDHNVSCTISYDTEEIPQIIDWFEKNWDDYIAVSFLLRASANRKSEDLGYAYLPQEVVTYEAYNSYVAQLKDIDLDVEDIDEPEKETCQTGACPSR